MKKLLQMKFMLLLCALIVGSGTMWAQTSETISANQFGFTSNTNLSDANATLSATNFTLTFAKNDASNVPAYNSGSEEFRLYKAPSSGKNGGSITIASKSENTTFTKIEFTFSNLPNNYSFSEGTYDKNKNEWSGTATTSLTLTNTDLSGQLKIKSMKVYYETTSSYTITAVSNNTELGTVSLSGTTITASPKAGCRYATPAYTVSPENSATVTQDGNIFTVTPTANTTITINFEAIPTHTATFSVNGTTTTTDFQEGAAIEFPVNPADIEGKSFVGWTGTAISGTTDETPTFVTSATMGNADITYYAVFADVEGTIVNASTSITAETNGVPDGYGSANTFTEYTLGGIKYKIQQMYKNGGKLQWRAAGNSSGTGTMYNTDSFQKINSIVLTYNSSDNGKNFTVNVGNSENPTSGTSITPTVNESVYTFDCSAGNYSYFVLTNGSGAGYLDEIVINYTTGSQTISGYCTTVAADTRAEAGLSYSEDEVEIELKNKSYNAVSDNSNPLINPNNLTDLTWSSTDETVATVSEGIVTLKAVGTTTITASFAGNDAYKPGSASFTLQVVDNRAVATVEFLDANNNNEPITVLNLKKGDNILGITPSCSVSYTFEDTNIKPAWGTNATHDNYEGDMPATYTLSSGNVFAMNVGTMTVTATFPGNQTHKPASATLTINVTGGTATDPYTVAQARAAIDAEAGTSDVYVKGIVCTAGSLDNGSISYWISDDGTTNNRLEVYSGKSYNGDNFSNSNDIQVGDKVTVHGNLTKYYSTYEFEAGSQLISLVRKPEAPTFSPAAGTYTSVQTVTISAADGAAIYYTTNGTDPTTESTQYSEPIAVNETTTIKAIAVKDSEVSDVATAEYVIDLTPSIVFDDKQSLNVLCTAGEADIHFVASNITGTVAVVLCDANGGAATYDWFSAALSNDNVHIQWQANEDPENSRTAFFKLTNGTTTSDIFALTQANYTVTYTLAHSITPGKHYIIASGTDGNVYVMGGQKNTNREAVEVEITTKNVISVTDEKTCEFIVSKDGAYYTFFDENLNGYLNATGAGGTNNNHLKTLGVNDNKGQWSISIDDGGVATVIANATGRNTMRFNNGSKLFSCYSTGQEDIYLFEKNDNERNLVIPIAAACTDGKDTPKYYGTFSSSSAFVVPENLTVSEIGINNDRTMNVQNYASGAIVPANTGVMVSATAGDRSYVVNVSNENEGTPIPDFTNALRPSGDDGITADEMDGKDSGCKFYRLTMHNGEKIGFWWGAANGVGFDIIAPNKAYLAVPTDLAGAREGFAFDEDSTTGISNVNVNENVNGSVFDLQGRKVSTPGKGLYIVNGKKVVIK